MYLVTKFLLQLEKNGRDFTIRVELLKIKCEIASLEEMRGGFFRHFSQPPVVHDEKRSENDQTN